MRWTDSQNSVICKPPGHTVVYATPGSGKTAVLTEHIRHVLNEGSIAPNQVLALTFTRQAAREMKSRLRQAKQPSVKDVESLRVGTFHGQIFQWLLSQQTKVPQLLTPLEQQRWVAKAMIATGDTKLRDIKQMMSVLSRYNSRFPAPPLPPSLQSVVDHYNIRKYKENRWDFDDILLDGYRLLTTHAEKGLQSFSVEYILVDEFQDTNEIQWKILNRLMVMTQAQLFVVGDDDQSIYAFRGSSPRWLLEASSSLPGAKRYDLTENFRSDQCIVHHAAALIHHNRKHVPKNWYVHSEQPGMCQVLYPINEFTQAQSIAQSLSLDRPLFGTAAVLARTRRQLVEAYQLMSATQRNQAEFRTFHEAKGREWDIVYILGDVRIGQTQDILGQSDGEEERRLFYVAMTRAKRKLCIYAPSVTAGKRINPSPFLTEAKLIP